MSEIKKGDKVKLVSGGPTMSVSEIADYSQGMGMGPKNGADCHWFDGNKPVSKVFDVEILEKQ